MGTATAIFRDRVEAGRRLAARLYELELPDPVVLGIPRGGVPVAAEVAAALHAPLDVLVVRKLGVPYQPELGMGAVGEDGVRVLNDEVVAVAGLDARSIAAVERRERAEVDARAERFRRARPRVDLHGRTAVVVDDGIATGGTALAALQVARAHGASRVVLAVPVAPPDTVDALRPHVDALVCLEQPEPFLAVGRWYSDFEAVGDAEVVRTLAAAAEPRTDPLDPADPTDPGSPGPTPTRGRPRATAPAIDEDVLVPCGPTALPGHLEVPEGATGLIVFAHGSGSSRHSPRNRAVAAALHANGLGTLLFDLLHPDEELDRRNVFDVELLAERLVRATAWARHRVPGIPVGYFGASTGAAAALWAASDPDAGVGAVVSRGGRPDLALARLGAVTAPTLLIVGGRDDVVLELNREAALALRCEHDLAVVPGATHLFEEPGALATVARLASAWFTLHLAPLADDGA